MRKRNSRLDYKYKHTKRICGRRAANPFSVQLRFYSDGCLLILLFFALGLGGRVLDGSGGQLPGPALSAAPDDEDDHHSGGSQAHDPHKDIGQVRNEIDAETLHILFEILPVLAETAADLLSGGLLLHLGLPLHLADIEIHGGIVDLVVIGAQSGFIAFYLIADL